MDLSDLRLDRFFGWRDARNGRTTAVRDVFFEALANAEKAVSGASTGFAQKFATSAWQAHRTLLTCLKGDAIEVLRRAYECAESLQEFERNFWQERRMKETVGWLGQEFVKAARAIGPKALGRKERRELGLKLEKLDRRLLSSRESNARWEWE